MEGPDLTGVGIRGYKSDWYEKHLAKSKNSEITAWKTAFSEISAEDLKAVAVFLDIQIGASELVRAKAQFNSLGCAGCHKVGKFGGDAGVDLTLSGFKDPNQLNFSAVSGEHTLSNWIAAHFRSPAATVRGSQMPALGLSESQIDMLTMYVLSLRRRTLPDIYLPKDRVRAMRFGAREFATDGETIYAAICSACHGARGSGSRFPGLVPNPSVAGREFLELASDEFLTATIAKGRSGRPMLAWGDRENGLTSAEIAAVVEYIRKLGGGIQFTGDARPARWAAGDPRLGERLFLANCAGCHGQKGEGVEGPAIGGAGFLAIASDSFLVETMRRGRSGTTMPAFGTPSVVSRALTNEEFEAITSYLRTMENK
jgi:mono/diheme cytochrome c family protein